MAAIELHFELLDHGFFNMLCKLMVHSLILNCMRETPTQEKGMLKVYSLSSNRKARLVLGQGILCCRNLGGVQKLFQVDEISTLGNIKKNASILEAYPSSHDLASSNPVFLAEVGRKTKQLK
jgi:hypothetical protein